MKICRESYILFLIVKEARIDTEMLYFTVLTPIQYNDKTSIPNGINFDSCC